MSELVDSTVAPQSAPEESTKRKALRIAGWFGLFLVFLVVFTFFKLPEARLKAYVQGSIASVLGARGIGLSATSSDLSIGLGVTYTLTGATLSFPPPRPSIKIEELSVSPRLISFLSGKMGADIDVTFATGGDISGSVELKDAETGNPSWMKLDLSIDEVDLAKTQVLAALAGLQGKGVIDGEIDATLDFSEPTASAGGLKIELKSGQIDAQNIMGFNIPALPLSRGEFDIQIADGKAQLVKAEVGKKGSNDGIVAVLKGDIKLARSLMASTLDVVAQFSLSAEVLKSFAILDAIMAQAKQGDGSYQYKLSGPIASPYPTPMPK